MRSKALTIGVLTLLVAAPPALADFPFAPQGPPGDYTGYYVTGEEPDDVGDGNGGEYFKYAASPDPANAMASAGPRSSTSTRVSTGRGRYPPGALT